MTAIYILLSISLVLSALCLVFMLLSLKKKEGGDLKNYIKIEGEKISSNFNSVVTMYNEMVKGALETQQNIIDKSLTNLTAAWDNNSEKINSKFTEFNKNLEEKLEKIRNDNSKSLAEVREDNEKQLNKMRETVDQKLSATLEERFNSSFKLVGDRLDALMKTLTELDSLQTGMKDLKKIFTNVKDRGTWGEVQLESLLSQILTVEQYSKNVNISGGNMVDFAINLPGKENDIVLLPIDAKFPVEDYQRLVEASANGDKDGVEVSSKAIESTIKKEAVKIKSKYISPPKTTDFAIMYLPSEGLFAEVMRRPGLSEGLQNNCHVVVCGPTTLSALLNSLQMGFKTLAIEKRSTEVWKLLSQFRKDFNTFSTLLEQSKTKLEQAAKTIDSAQDRTRIIQNRLSKVDTMPSLEEESGTLFLESGEAVND